MKHAIATACGAAALVLAISNVASAQEQTWFEREIAAPDDAVELSVSTGYTQGFGMLRQGTPLPDVANAGMAVGLGLGYRLGSHWGISLNGQYQELDASRGSGTRGGTATAAVQYHFAPYQHLDPWAELGGGYRMFWETPEVNAPSVLSHGLQLARARIGADVRVTPDVAVGPFIGADVNAFLYQEGAAIDNPRLSTFVLAGVQGRFDVGGERTLAAAPAFESARR